MNWKVTDHAGGCVVVEAHHEEDALYLADRTGRLNIDSGITAQRLDD